MPVKITSKYTPLTYDEITKPLIQATEAQMAVENAYMDAQDKASAAMAQANQETDPIAYSKLKSYADDLQAQADSLMRYGLQRSSRQSLLNMRRRYGEEITPIAAAIERRNALSEEQRKLEAANPYLRHERDMRTVSLDAMLDNPNMDYGRSIDLSDVQKRAATLVKAMGQGRTDVKYGKQLDKYTKEVLMREGFTPEEIQAALSNDGNANQALSAALDNLYASTGADSFRAGVDTEVWDAIQQGAMMGAGEVKATIRDDKMAERRDYLADRAHSEAFQAAMNGYMWDRENKKWVKDPTNPGKNSSSSSVTYKDASGNIVPMENAIQDPTSNKVYLVGEDGKLYTANGKNIVAEVPNSEDILRRLENRDLNTFYITHGKSYVDSFDGAYRVDNEYGKDSFAHFIDVFSDSDFLDDKGNFKKDVHVIDNIALPKEGVYSKSQAAHVLKKVGNTKTDNSDWVVVVVDRNWPNDDDYFLIKKDHLSEYKKAAIESRGGAYEELEFK